jgi:hypothetical protein
MEYKLKEGIMLVPFEYRVLRKVSEPKRERT